MTVQPDTGNVRPLHPFADAWTADKLMQHVFPDPKWAVPGLFPEGLSVVAGPPKAGKSLLALNAGLAIAAGTMAFNAIEVDQGPVLYLALEDVGRRLQHRLGKMLQGGPAPAGLALPTDCPTLGAGGADMIRGWLDHHRDARMVVIDVFAKVRGQPAGSNAYADDYRATGYAKDIADDYGIAVILVHHTRKAGAEDFLEQLSGTNGIAGAADAVHVLERARYAADGVLHTTGRDVDETERALRLDTDTFLWTLLDGPAVDHTLHDTSAAILRYVRSKPGATPREIADALELDYVNIRRTCARMAKRDHLVSLGGGQYAAPPTEVGQEERP